VIKFSESIANCETLEELTKVESMINLEKTRSLKYQEFLSEAVEKFNSLNSLVAKQKTHIKELTKMEEDMKEADEDRRMELEEKKSQIEEQIHEGTINVQESAINSAVNESEYAETVSATVKARRTTWKWEVKDIKAAFKKMPSWVKMEIDEEKLKDYLKACKEQGQLEDKEEFEFAGIRFFKQKLF
jgi:hypothetical protein